MFFSFTEKLFVIYLYLYLPLFFLLTSALLPSQSQSKEYKKQLKDSFCLHILTTITHVTVADVILKLYFISAIRLYLSGLCPRHRAMVM